VRTRAAGISQAATIADKVRAWARAIEARADPLLACLGALQSQSPEAIAANVLNRNVESEERTETSAATHAPAAVPEVAAAEFAAELLRVHG
jgi:hypothetical protein